jgi:kumamolisin
MEIPDGAVRCGHCTSIVGKRNGNASVPASGTPDSYTIEVSRDLAKYARVAAIFLCLFVVIAAFLYLYGFHLSKEPPNSEQLKYTYVLDQDIVRFAKFSGAVLAVFVTTGIFLFGFELKTAVKETSAARNEIARTKLDVELDHLSLDNLVKDARSQSDEAIKTVSNMQLEVKESRLRAEELLNDATKIRHDIKSRNAEVEDMHLEIRRMRDETRSLMKQTLRDAAKIAPQYDKEEISRTSKSKTHEAKTSISALELADIYEFPSSLDGTGQCIGIIDLGGGYIYSDLVKYFGELQLSMPEVTFVSVDKAKNDPDSAAGYMPSLAIQIAGAVAPKAHIVSYVGKNTSRGFANAIRAAIRDKDNRPTILTIGWGSPEINFEDDERTKFNNLLEEAARSGITVLCSAGDSGADDPSRDGQSSALFPACSPWVVACGGTQLSVVEGRVVGESAWLGSDGQPVGGGVSRYFPRPEWQEQVEIPGGEKRTAGRLIPDVAAHAATDLGYYIIVKGSETNTAGTAAVSPLWAGLIARLNQGLGSQIGYLNPILYQTLGPSGSFRRISMKGDRAIGSSSSKTTPQWKPIYGWGSPNGEKLLDTLSVLRGTFPLKPGDRPGSDQVPSP